MRESPWGCVCQTDTAWPGQWRGWQEPQVLVVWLLQLQLPVPLQYAVSFIAPYILHQVEMEGEWVLHRETRSKWRRNASCGCGDPWSLEGKA